MVMNSPHPHFCLTLRGNQAEEGITISNNRIPFAPRWGMLRHDPGVLGVSSVKEGRLKMAYIAIVGETPVLYPSEETSPQRELVLVQEYSPGVGSKRSPSFHVEFGEEVRVLSSVTTWGGSGKEKWTLISAPIGWAANIAGQFIDQRGYPGQTISYCPEAKKGEEELSLIEGFRKAGFVVKGEESFRS